MKRRGIAILIFIIVVSITAGVFVHQPFWQKINGFRPWSLGLDLAGGSYLVYKIDLSQVDALDQDAAVKGLRDVIERRVNLFGVSEPRVYTETAADEKRLIVELAGVKEISAAIRIIGETPFLDFREVTEDSFIPTALNGRYVKNARVDFDSITRQSVVALEFTAEGAEIFEELTEQNIGRPIAIFLDNQLIEMPVVREKISGGRAQITGNFTLDSARELVQRFNAGALPAPITLVNQQTVSAELGEDSLDRAIQAGAIGTLAIMLFMIAYYRGFGLFAFFALLMYMALTLAVFKIIPITLTLAGIAGFILSIGMAVDANILVFERTREELKKGLPRTAAVEEGFRRAWTSIRDSNITTLITSLILYYFTSSFVRGFALALAIGVLVSMFSAITITRTMLRVFLAKTKQND
jgi:protein-export SecD/SecF family membrane protein